ncbi:MAG: hypothetical protein WDA75_06025, partial [Candidatus Latescibacterota bacterium]
LAGKMEAFELAEALFPELHCWNLVRAILHAGYEAPRWYEEPHLTELEDALEEGLTAIARRLRDAVTLVPAAAGVDLVAWKAALASVPLDPALVIFDNAKFARLMKGRLQFYCRAPARFATRWLIQNELKRIGESFFRAPFRTYWKLRTGQQVEDPACILDELRGDPLTDDEVEGARRFAELTPGHWEEGSEYAIAREIAESFDDFFRALTRISEAVATGSQCRVREISCVTERAETPGRLGARTPCIDR